NTVSGYADKFVQKFGLNLQSTTRSDFFIRANCHKVQSYWVLVSIQKYSAEKVSEIYSKSV
ncbi:hypothetical protein DQM21_11605, partial [Levilactobacillus brevis]